MMPGKSKLDEETKGRLKSLYIQQDKLIERIGAAKKHGEKHIRWNWLFTLSIREAEEKLANIRKEIVRMESMYEGLKMGMRPGFAH